ncbi:MAG: hypothetical protein K0S56_1497 [Microvirga sp.]|jgi:hypothetical protein|nr:hypothetical protein [Microvirga sp.]
MSDPIGAITELLREEHGIPPAKLHPSARLSHDLGVDGDDASDLLQRLHERFGTEFSALNEQWSQFFNHEGASPRSILIALALMIPCTALTVWIAVRLDLSASVCGVLNVVVFFASWIVLGRLFPAKPKRPVTIEGLADVIRAGAWPDDPADVR